MNLGTLTFEEVKQIADKIEGWFNPNESKLLYNLAQKVTGMGSVVEIGSWAGKSMTYLSAGLLNKGTQTKVFSIDPFLTSKNEPNGAYEKFMETMKKLNISDKVTNIREKSQDAGKKFDEKIELLFIDGFHRYDSVKADYEIYFPKVIENGIIAFHDVGWYDGPTRVVKEIAESSENFKILGLEDLTLYGQKVAKLTEPEKAENLKFLDIVNKKVAEKEAPLVL